MTLIACKSIWFLLNDYFELKGVDLQAINFRYQLQFDSENLFSVFVCFSGIIWLTKANESKLELRQYENDSMD